MITLLTVSSVYVLSRPSSYLRRGKVYININISLHHVVDISRFIPITQFPTPCPCFLCHSWSLVSGKLQVVFSSFSPFFSPSFACFISLFLFFSLFLLTQCCHFCFDISFLSSSDIYPLSLSINLLYETLLLLADSIFHVPIHPLSIPL